MGGIIFKFPINDSEEFVSDAVPVDYDNDIETENGYEDNEDAAAWCRLQEELYLIEHANSFGSPQY